MSKLTFRADEDLIDRVEALEASKSEVMRAALRQYLDTVDPGDAGPWTRHHRSLDALVAERVDTLVEQHLAQRRRDIDLNITVSGETAGANSPRGDAVVREASAGSRDRVPTHTCAGCGEPVHSDSVYCPRCRRQRSARVLCECGDELRPGWSFCPSCGRRTPGADLPAP